DGDDAAVTPPQLILEAAHAAVRLERREQAFPIPRIDVEIDDPLRAERLVLVDAEHAFQRRIRRDQIAVDRRLENAVDDVVEEAAIARLALAKRGLVLLAADRDAGELREPRDHVELVRLRAARRAEEHAERAVDAVAGGHDRRRAARRDAGGRERRPHGRGPRIGLDVADDDRTAE